MNFFGMSVGDRCDCAANDDVAPANHISELTDADLETLSSGLENFEHARSHERQELFHRLDALSAELVRRYRDGEASIDGLLADE